MSKDNGKDNSKDNAKDNSNGNSNNKKEEVVKHESKLLKKTIELYENRSIKLTNEEISEKTGLGYPWICAFRNIEEPSVQKIETLYEFLAQKRLNLN